MSKSRFALIEAKLGRPTAAGAERQRQANEVAHWQAFEQLRLEPTEHNAREAKRSFLALAKRHHPDQGGSHHAFLRVKDAYDRARAVWRRPESRR
jgi:hypothetical protein